MPESEQAHPTCAGIGPDTPTDGDHDGERPSLAPVRATRGHDSPLVPPMSSGADGGPNPMSGESRRQ